MRLRNRKSAITGLPEGKPRRTIGSRITKWTYFLILIAIVVYLGDIGVFRFNNYSGKGYVEVEKIKIDIERGGRIANLFISNGQHVDKGEKLALIVAAKKCSLVRDSKSDAIQHNIDLTQVKLATLKLQLKNKIKKQNRKTAALKVAITTETAWQEHLLKGRQSMIVHEQRTENIRRALEVKKSRAESIDFQQTKPLVLFKPADLAKSNEQIKDDIDKLKIEIAHYESVLKAQQQSLMRNQQYQTDRINVQNAVACQDEVVASPVSGRINNISYHRYEMIGSNSTLAVITPDEASVSIETYLSKDHLRHLNIGSKVDVIFPDKETSHGTIAMVESTANQTINRKWDGYDHFPSRILIKILPSNMAEQKKWIPYDRMEVRVRGKK